MRETDIQSTIIRYLAILETQGKLFLIGPIIFLQ